MCATYHASTEESLEMREIINQVIQNFPAQQPADGLIRPSMTAAVIGPQGPAPMSFGISLPNRKGLLLNCRSEGAAFSPLFSPMLKSSRCLIPANDFYEWTPQKKAHIFSARDGGLLYFAGLFLPGSPAPRFVIMTRQADETVSPIHERMPLILSSAEYRDAWMRSQRLALELLHIPSHIELTGIPA